ncbi:MAG: hypothetical protein HY304_02275 [candidate division Zixibacteria bacterium]|nr:hypothetical protein [candidate division Zixibacteria bacterium]
MIRCLWTAGRINLILVTAATSAWTAGRPSAPSKATASLELRIVKDSLGCPVAIDLWLASTSDSIQGIEAVVGWDHPQWLDFALAGSDPSGKDTTALGALLGKAVNPRSRVALDAPGGLLSTWELLEARRTGEDTIKFVGVARLFGQHPGVPVLPGASGRLCRFSLTQSVSSASPDPPDSMLVSLEPSGTRVSDPNGILFSQVKLKQDVTAIVRCRASKH